jgi:ribosome biogenesis GTPase A
VTKKKDNKQYGKPRYDKDKPRYDKDKPHTERANKPVSKPKPTANGDVGGDVVEINWFPGHMTRASRDIAAEKADITAVVTDSRCPKASNCTAITNTTLVILNKSDLADEYVTKLWAEHYRALGAAVLVSDSKNGTGIAKFQNAINTVLAEKLSFKKAKGIKYIPYVIITGIPNSGKSSFINKLSGGKKAAVSDRPGVTRARRQINCNDFVLIDTPGVLPKKLNGGTALKLAWTGAVKDTVYDTTLIAEKLGQYLFDNYPTELSQRYKVTAPLPPTPEYPILTAISYNRGFLIQGGNPDIGRAAAILLDEFRGGKIGKITLEIPKT